MSNQSYKKYNDEFAPRKGTDESNYDYGRQSYEIGKRSKSANVNSPTHLFNYDEEKHRLAQETDCITRNSLRVEIQFQGEDEEFRAHVVEAVTGSIRHEGITGIRHEAPVANVKQVIFDLQKDITPQQAIGMAKELTAEIGRAVQQEAAQHVEKYGRRPDKPPTAIQPLEGWKVCHPEKGVLV